MTYRWLSDEPFDVEMVSELFREYQRELGIDLCFQGFDEELAGLPGQYAPPQGGILVVFDDQNAPAACAALRDLGAGVGEIKRLYVRPDYRRRGLARSMSLRLIERARKNGFDRLRLDTLRRLAGASELYAEMGFVEIEPYNFNPEPDIVYMQLNLRIGS